MKPTVAQHAATSAPKKGKATKQASPKKDVKGPNEAREGSKKAIVLDMLKRADGATLKNIMSATGWQAHSVRGFISGSLSKQMGIKVESFKSESGDRAYRLAR